MTVILPLSDHLCGCLPRHHPHGPLVLNEPDDDAFRVRPDSGPASPIVRRLGAHEQLRFIL